ncbi:hypothetical protein Dimus_015856 [Dionaea muscipula]
MTVIHLKKKDVVKSKVRGVEVEFDHEKLATILVKDHELPYGDWMTMVFEAFGVPLVNKKGEEPKRYDYFEETFLTMCKLRREDGVWWIGRGENRRRDDDIDVPKRRRGEKEEENQTGFDWEAIIDEAATEGESGSDDQFYDAQVGKKNRVMKLTTTPAIQLHLRLNEKIKNYRSRPSGPTSEEGDFPKFQASLKEREQTDFMMNWRRRKSRMPNF